MTLLLFFLGSALSVMLTWLIRQVANKWDLMDRPGLHKQHGQITPTLGGVAIYLSFLACLFLMPWSAKLVTLFAAATLVVVTGALDDVRSVPATYKLAVLAVASILVYSGKWSVGLVQPSPAGMVMCFLWVGLVSSAFNGVDNADGAAGGLAFISAALVTAFSASQGRWETAQLAASMAGCCLGFLYWNFPNPKATIFLGDSGSLLIGLLLSCLTLEVAPYPGWTVLLLGALLMAVPLFDFCFILLVRGLKGHYRSWTDPITMCARDHTFHRLVLRYSPQKSVLLMYAYSAAAGLVALMAWISAGESGIQNAFLLCLSGAVFLGLLLNGAELPVDVYSDQRSVR